MQTRLHPETAQEQDSVKDCANNQLTCGCRPVDSQKNAIFLSFLVKLPSIMQLDTDIQLAAPSVAFRH